MSRIKPIGSEKLQGDEKLKRILEIARYKDCGDPGKEPCPTICDYQKCDYRCEDIILFLGCKINLTTFTITIYQYIVIFPYT